MKASSSEENIYDYYTYMHASPVHGEGKISTLSMIFPAQSCVFALSPWHQPHSQKSTAHK